MKIKAFPTSKDGASFYRFEQPVNHIPEIELDWSIADLNLRISQGYTANLNDLENIGLGDFNIFQRIAAPFGVRLMNQAKLRGLRLWMEQDDNFHALGSDNPLYSSWKKLNLDLNLEAFGLADGVIVSTKELVKAFKTHQPNIHAVNNYLDLDLYTALSEFEAKKAQREADQIVTVGYAGSWLHNADIYAYKDLFKQLSEMQGVRLVFIGYDPRVDFPAEFNFPITFIEWSSDIKTYYAALLDIDIGLAICKDNAFNRCKSDIKFLEYSGGAIPCVAAGPCYQETVKNGESGFLAKHEGDMLRKVQRLVKDRDLRRSMGLEARKYVVEKRQIQNNIWRYRKVLGLD